MESTPLYRSGSLVSSLSDAFGRGLRETRLTAMLGYLIALEPSRWMKPFGFLGQPTAVEVEHQEDTGRSDIHVTTTKGTGVIEAKLGAMNPMTQCLCYDARWRVLLTSYVPTPGERKQRGLRFMGWASLGDLLADCGRTGNPRVRFLARDLRTYLMRHGMMKANDSDKRSVEIYAREINTEPTLNLFLRSRLYQCEFKKNSRLPEALYFAPHFGRKIADAHPGVHQGISYIARIEQVEVVSNWNDIISACRTHRGAAWTKKHRSHLLEVHPRNRWGGQQRSFLFLGEPRLVFAPAVRKENLQGGSGWLSKHFLSFDELYAAWSK